MAAENKILNNAIVKIGNAQSEEHRLTVYHSDNTSVSIYGYGLYMSRTNSYIRPSNDGSQILAIGTDNNTWNYVALDTNYFTVSTNASEHFRITNTGNVGIGTTSPNYKLDVNGEAQLGYINFEYSSNYAGVRWKDSGYNLRWKIGNDGPSGNWLYLYDYAMSSSAFTFKPNSDMLFTPGGNVGIGTTSPNSKLHVSDTTDISMSGGSAGQVAIEGNGYTGAIALDATAMHIYHNSGARDLVLGTNETARLTISGSSGNVGIGTASPSEKLSVAGNIALVSNNSFISFNTSASSGDPKIQMGSDGDFSFLNTAGSTNLHIENAGKVGIGTTSPIGKLTIISEDTTANPAISIRQTNSASQGWDFDVENNNIGRLDISSIAVGNNKNARISILKASGNVGIGTTSPTSKLHIFGGSANTELKVTTNDNYIARLGLYEEKPGNLHGGFIQYRGESGDRLEIGSRNSGTDTVHMSIDDVTGNVGIGTTSPTYKLDVAGNVNISGTGGFLRWNSGDIAIKNEGSYKIGFQTYNTTSSTLTTKMVLDTNGNVGIGTTSPETKLQVNGAVYGMLGLYSDHTYSSNRNWRIVTNAFGAGNWGGLAIKTSDSAGSTPNTTRFGIDYLGNVGIGTTSPSSKLHVVGDTYVTGQFAQGVAVASKIVSYGAEFRSSGASAQIFFGRSTNSIGSGAIGADDSYVFRVWKTSDFSQPFVIQQSGNVGIGTTSPSSKLHVNIPGNSVAFRASRNNGTDGDLEISFSSAITAYNSKVNGHRWLENGSEKMRLNAGNLGIGTTSPGAKLDVRTSSDHIAEFITTTADSLAYIRVQNNVQSSTDTNTAAAAIELVGKADASGHGRHVWIGAEGVNNTDYRTKLKFKVRNGANDFDWSGTYEGPTIMTLDGNGNVGIGTTSPGQKLHVVGNVKFDGSRDIDFDTTDGNIRITPNTGGWATGYLFNGSAGTNRGGFGGFGSTNALTYYWIGDGYNDTTMVVQPNAGNVGIGTTSPASKLHVQSGAGIFNVSDDWHQSTYRTHLFRGGGFNSSISEESTAVKIFNGSAVDGKAVGNYWGGIAFMHLDPEYSSWGTSYTGEHFWIGGRLIDTPGQERSALVFATNNLTTSGSHSSEKMVILPNGNVGIGTTSPGAKLTIVSGGKGIHVDKGGHSSTSASLSECRTNYGFAYDTLRNGSTTGFFITNVGTNTPAMQAVDSSNNAQNISIQPYGGNVGIGTTSPDKKLEIKLTDTSSGTYYAQTIGGSNHLAGYAVGIGFDPEGYGNRNKVGIIVEGASTGWSTGHMHFVTKSDTGAGSDGEATIANARMTITSGGNVGIGTVSPGAKLDVAGSIGVTSGNTFGFDNYNGSIYMASSGRGLLGKFGGSGYARNLIKSDGSATVHIGDNTSLISRILLDAGSSGANGYISLQTKQVERVRINQDGNVGIGTTSPGAHLHVSASSDAHLLIESDNTMSFYQDAGWSSTMMFGAKWNGTNQVYGATTRGAFKMVALHDGDTSPQYLAIYGANHGTAGGTVTWNTVGFAQDEDGNVGIGTTSPGAKLDVTTNHQAQTAIRVTHNNYNDYVLLKRRSDDTQKLGIKEENSNGSMGLFTADTTRVTITSAGNVGIGTTSPAQKLDVNGDIAVKGASVINKASAALTIGDTAGTDSVTSLNLTTAGRNTEVFLDDAGNVGINTATPSYNLTVDSGTNDIGILTASSDSGSYVGFLDNSTSTIPKIGAVGNKLILDASQYVGIKRTDPSYALDVSGTIRATGDVIAYSDARVKENVETIPNALDKVKAMRGVGYNKIGEEKRSIGVIAQEMLEVMPEAVHKDDSGMYSVAYGNLVGVLIEAMKEQQSQIDELKARLDGSTK